MNAGAAEHCRALVRRQDKDLFLADLFLPEAAQPAAFALHAFACEISRITHLVSEPQIGEIRLQWWAETLEGLTNGQAQDHPIGGSSGRGSEGP
ncbi:MAG: squalene/phytoene synthase family protein [Hyphomicrobiales bacterium]